MNRIAALIKKGSFALLLLHAVAAFAQPQAHNDFYMVLQGSCRTGLTVTANDAYTVLDSAWIVTAPLHGQASFSGSKLTYCANANYSGTDKLLYTLLDTAGKRDTALVFMSVLAPNTTVFPGDADNNGLVENFDVLALGLAYGASGPPRASTDSIQSFAWDPSSYINSNPGAADGNNDGIVDFQDQNEIASNYNRLNTAIVYQPRELSAVEPDGSLLELVALNDTVHDLDTLQLSLHLGSSAQTAQAYGIAFRLELDSNCMRADLSEIKTETSWLAGSRDSSLLFNHSLFTRNNLALVKTNHRASSGGGTILTIKIPVIDNIDGVIRPAGKYPLQIIIKQVRLISAFDIAIPIAVKPIQLTMKKEPNGIPAIPENIWQLYPNPALSYLTVRSAETIEELYIVDALGREVLYAAPKANTETILLKNIGLPQGSYLLKIQTKNGVYVKHFTH
ncbi:MAG: T9SS type A sorting domain-containing protein [Chitinophagales bacterium]